jgi:hypothetical protein
LKHGVDKLFIKETPVQKHTDQLQLTEQVCQLFAVFGRQLGNVAKLVSRGPRAQNFLHRP